METMTGQEVFKAKMECLNFMCNINGYFRSTNIAELPKNPHNLQELVDDAQKLFDWATAARVAMADEPQNLAS